MVEVDKSADITSAKPRDLDSREVVERLSRSKIYRDYERAFSEASGLPMSIRPVEMFQLALREKKNENPFCAIMAESNQSCSACLMMQAQLEKEARLEPKTLRCFAGLCDTAVPLRVGENVVAFLQTGQVLLHAPTREHFDQITRKLISMGAKVNLKRLEEAYFQSKVLTEEQYQAFIRLLATFADHLSAISNVIMVSEKQAEPEIVSRARRYILENYQSSLSLGEAAKKVNTSAHYFCKMFKKATGMTFTEYLTRIRIEKAKNLLLNPNKRVSEVAYDIGFESLSQFNRSFKRITGMTPTRYRESLESWDFSRKVG